MSSLTSSLTYETSTTTGTGNFTVSAVTSWRRFSDEFAAGATEDVFFYFIRHQAADEWEIGTGHLSATSTLVRDTVIKSSNSDALVSFTSGTKDVTSDVPAIWQYPRKALTEDTIFYVRTDGSDSNDGSANTAGSAFLTPQGAYDYILNNVDCNGYFVKIKMGAGEYDATATKRRRTDEFSTDKTVLTANVRLMNCPCVEFEGTTISGTTDFSGNGTIWDADGGLCAYISTESGLIRFQGIAFVDNSATSDTCLFANNSCTISISQCDFGAGFSTYHIHIGPSTCLKIFADYSISGGTAFHIFAEQGADVDHENCNVQCVGTPAFSSAFLLLTVNSNYAWINVTFGGSATGKRFIIEDSTVTAGGDLNTLLPGNSDGTWSIKDPADNEMLAFSQVASATNYFEMRNAATTDAPRLRATGSDSNVDFNYDVRGTSGVHRWSINATSEMNLDSTSLSPAANDGTALGDATRGWSDLFLASGSVIDFDSNSSRILHTTSNESINIHADVGDTTADSAVQFNVDGANRCYVSAGVLTPNTNDGLALGFSGVGWSDLFLASGGAVNWSNGNVTLTHATDELQLGGNLVPATSDTYDLGAPGDNWQQIFLSNTGEIRWNNGSHVIEQEVQWLSFYIDQGNAVANSGIRINIDGTNTYQFLSGALSPMSNDLAALGTNTLNWSDLYLADGGTINWNNTESRITHNTTTGSLVIEVDEGNASGASIFQIDIDGSNRCYFSTSALQGASDGSYDLGTSAVGFGELFMASSGNGISFDGGSNYLDDYEEGTWTPGLWFNGVNITSSSGSYDAQNGTYTKIGNVVHVWGRIDVASIGTASGSAQIVSLPFNTTSSTNYRTIGSVNIDNLNVPANYAGLHLESQTNDARLDLAYYNSSTGDGTFLSDSEFSGDEFIEFQCTYMTDS